MGHPRYRFEASSGRLSVEIAEAELTDAGKYTCTATNSHGQADTSCKVDISGQ